MPGAAIVPDTTAYMIGGYVLTILIFVGSVIYMMMRRRRLSAEKAELEALTDNRR